MKLPAVFGKKRKVKRVRDGKTERRKCPQCGETAQFREVTVDDKWTAYHVIKLWGSQSTGFQCTACDEVMEIEDTEDPELSEREKKQKLKLEEKAAKQHAAQADQRRQEAEDAAAQQEQAIDDELAQMKKKLGID